MRSGRRRAIALGMALATSPVLIVAGCSTGGEGQPDWPPSPSIIEVTMSEYAFSLPSSVPSGRVVFLARNSGSLAHELQLFPLNDDIPPIDAQLRGTQRRVLNPLAGIPRREPGEMGTFSVELLAEHRYALICFLKDGGTTHATEGMNAEFRPGAS